MHLIELKKICKIYNPGENEVRAADNISLTVDEGEFIAIVGSSGSGKSTLMNIIGFLDVPTSGTYKLKGKDVSHLSDNELSDIRNREIGFIFQGFNLIPSLSAVENVELPLVYRGVGKAERHEAAMKALEKVGIEKRANHLPSQLSGGQQQRVAVARAIASEPAIILADEPTGNLDSKSGADVMKLLHNMNDSGRTVILITHDNGIAETIGRRILISDGKVVKNK